MKIIDNAVKTENFTLEKILRIDSLLNARAPNVKKRCHCYAPFEKEIFVILQVFI